MTKEELKQYGSLKKEIASLEEKLDKLYDKQLDIPVVAGKVTASSKEFPFTPYRVSVQMDDPKASDDLQRLIRVRKSRLEKCRKLLCEIEEFIEAINDSDTRLIFQHRFIDGLKLTEVADKVGLERSVVGKRIKNFLNLPTMPTKSMLELK